MQVKEGGPGGFQAASPGRAPPHFTSKKDLVSWTPEAFQGFRVGEEMSPQRSFHHPTHPSVYTPAALASTSGPTAWTQCVWTFHSPLQNSMSLHAMPSLSSSPVALPPSLPHTKGLHFFLKLLSHNL